MAETPLPYFSENVKISTAKTGLFKNLKIY